MRRSCGLGRVGIVVGLVILSVLLVGSVWIVPYLPTNDGPEWVFATHIENHYGDPATPYYKEAYIPALQFASRGFTLLYGPLDAWLGWQRGLQAALGVVTLVVAWSFVALVRALDPRRTALGFLGFPLALSWTFYMGFWAFALGTGGGLLVLAFAVRTRRREGLPVWACIAVSLFLLFVAIAHIFAAVLTGVALLLLLVLGASPGRRLAELGKVVLMGLPAGAIAVASVVVARSTATKVASSHDTVWFAWRELLALLPQTLWPGPMWRAVVAVVGIVVAGVVAFVRARRAETSGVDRGLAIAGIVFLLATVFAPASVPGWQFLAQRFATPGMALALAVLPLERLRPRVQGLATGALFGTALASVALSYPMHRRLAALCSDAIAGLAAPVHRTGLQLPVALAATEGAGRPPGEVPLLNPLLHMGALYAAVEGGLIPYAFASSGATHSFTLRPDGTRQPVRNIQYYWGALGSDAFQTNAGFRRDVEEDLASYGMLFEGVVLLGARPLDISLWRARGYVADWERGAAFVGHFEPCGMDFTAPPGMARPGPTFDVGWGRFEPIQNARVLGTVAADDLAHFALDQAPCGDIRVRARWGAAVPGGAARVCSNSDPDGYVRATITRTSRHVACTEVVAGVAKPMGAPVLAD